MSIRLLTKEDVKLKEKIQSLYTLCNERRHVSPTFTHRVLENDLNDPVNFYTQDGHAMFICLTRGVNEEDELIGMVGIVPYDSTQTNDVCFAEIQRLVVEPKHRKKGIGRGLMEAVDRYIRWGVSKYDSYLLSVIGNNRGALKFYRKLSFLQEYETVERYSETDHIKYSLIYFKNKN